MRGQLTYGLSIKTGIKAGETCGADDARCCAMLLTPSGSVERQVCGTGVGTAQIQCIQALNENPSWDVLGIVACPGR